MTGRDHAERLWANLLDLGPRRLAALGIVGAIVTAIVGLGAVYLSGPQMDVLYAGLDREDVSRIGATLREAGIPFDVNATGDAVLVSYGQTAPARMLLAERGLPQSANAGYELFDQLGSLGLTSFMQQVTKVRALEGEIARTIQSMKGIKAARVHLVLPDEGSFRRASQQPSASVIIRTDTSEGFGSAQAVRHLVSAAVPGLPLDQVTILNTEGMLLASGDDAANASSGKIMTLEASVSKELQERIRTTLTPYLGLDNFEISVSARLNTDRKEISETIFDPESRVERSVRVVKETGTSQNMSTEAAATVEQNLPDQQTLGEGGEQSTEETERREETTNYELSSKTVVTTSDGYLIESLSIAVLVNRGRLAETLGADAAPAEFDAQLAEIRQLVASAAGVSEARGDQLKVSAVEFFGADRQIEPVPPLSIAEMMMRQMGTVINAATILVVAMLLIWFGLRPATRALLARPHPAEAAAAEIAAGEGVQVAAIGTEANARIGTFPEANLIEDLTSKPRRSPQRRLE
ncbi:MAG TPA: flagellar basal-body MS-ring/collar protein FliF, partial [Propylenella sp.]|nr:flagellar basal-body MS-ring/collar protein FliF [Propylenella sp.]